MKKFEVYVDGSFMGFVRASNQQEAEKLAREKYVDWPEQELKVYEED